MKLRFPAAGRNLLAACGLLVLLLCLAEVWMRGRTPVAPVTISRSASDSCQQLLEPSETSHHQLRSVSSTVVGGADGRIQINAAGCRGPELRAPGTEHPYRILLLGDDVVFGSGLPDDRTLAAWLGQLLPSTSGRAVEIINAGVPGYCPLLAWLHYEHHLNTLRPDLVILHIDMSDVADDQSVRPFFRESPERSVCVHPSLLFSGSAENSALAMIRKSALGTWCLNTARRAVVTEPSLRRDAGRDDAPFAWIADHPPDLRIQVRHCLDPIHRLNDSVRQAGGELWVTTAPVRWQLLSSDTAPELSVRCRIEGVTPYSSQLPFDVLQQYCGHIGVNCTDTSASFRGYSQPERLFSLTEPVLSDLGTALYAREIARALLADPPARW